MAIKPINSQSAPVAAGGYAQAVEVTETARRLYISGQIPVTRDGEVPTTFKAQAQCAWANVEAQLAAAGMNLTDLVKITTFLSDRKFSMENREVRQAVLGDHAPALTVIVCDIFDDAWLLEIEAIAEA